MNRLYFIRHGEGVDNLARQFSRGKVDRPLTERGRLQAREAGEYLAGKNIHAIYCSTMKRSHETAQIISARLGLEPVVLEEFREVDVGELDGKDFSVETWGAYHQVVNEWLAGNVQAALPGGENYVTMWERTRRGLMQMLDGRTGRNLLLVGHAGIFTATLREVCPDLDVDWLKNAEYYNCAITELEIESVDGRLQGRLIDWANYSHLSEETLSRVPGIPPMEARRSSS
jgi:2,3-bisphosphoglycerate-dependent phosphoglycerate mutase